MRRVWVMVAVGVAVATSAAAGGWWWWESQRQAVHPDLIVITWDTTRADHIGAYGYFRDTTPSFDALAARSVLFEHHVVPQATTLPTHLSLFTGVYPDEHGVINNSNDGDRFVVPEGLTTLASHLGAAGYETAAFVSATPLKQTSGIHRGFDLYSEPADKSRDGAETTDAALAWLAAERDEPWLLWVHLFDPHMPYRPHDDFPMTDHADERDAWLKARQMEPNARTRKRIDRYDSEIRYADEQLRRLLSALEALPDRDRVLVVAGDHGESLGEHNHLEHGRVWRGELEAPLLIRAPRTPARRVATVMSTVDILPTLLGLAVWPGEPTLLAQASGRDALGSEPEPVLSRTSLRQSRLTNHPGRAIAPRWAITTDEWTYVYDSRDREYLFDRATNPLELGNDLWGHRDVAPPFSRHLKRLRARHVDRATALGAGQTRASSDEEREELEALGYIE